MGFAPEQIVRDVLDPFESLRQILTPSQDTSWLACDGPHGGPIRLGCWLDISTPLPGPMWLRVGIRSSRMSCHA
ncbi:hypothetical protein D9M71_439470 [compost metagenome]